jgi:hypothetical protein
MQLTTIKKVSTAIILAAALPLSACGDENPTSPTQPGPPVLQGPIISLTGQVAILDRSGPGDMEISFRIDDFTIVKAGADTPVLYGGQVFRTDAVRPRQTVTAEGRRSNGSLYATKITIVAQAP